MTYLSALLLAGATIGLVYVRRAQRAEAVTILIVALPVVLAVSRNAQPWLDSLRASYALDEPSALQVAPPVIAEHRNLPLARHALLSIPSDATYAVVPNFRFRQGTSAGQRERARLKFLNSWLQYWLAPRLRVDPVDAQWLILLNSADRPRREEVYRFGTDLLVRK